MDPLLVTTKSSIQYRDIVYITWLTPAKILVHSCDKLRGYCTVLSKILVNTSSTQSLSKGGYVYNTQAISLSCTKVYQSSLQNVRMLYGKLSILLVRI